MEDKAYSVVYVKGLHLISYCFCCICIFVLRLYCRVFLQLNKEETPGYEKQIFFCWTTNKNKNWTIWLLGVGILGLNNIEILNPRTKSQMYCGLAHARPFSSLKVF